MTQIPAVRLNCNGSRVTALDLRLDPEKVTAAFESLRRSVTRAAETITAGLRSMQRRADQARARRIEAANAPAVLAGLEARYQVRAGLDPAYATPAARDALLRAIIDGTDSLDLRWVTGRHRCRIAAAAARGWVESYPPVVVSDRRYGQTRVVIARG